MRTCTLIHVAALAALLVPAVADLFPMRAGGVLYSAQASSPVRKAAMPAVAASRGNSPPAFYGLPGYPGPSVLINDGQLLFGRANSPARSLRISDDCAWAFLNAAHRVPIAPFTDLCGEFDEGGGALPLMENLSGAPPPDDPAFELDDVATSAAGGSNDTAAGNATSGSLPYGPPVPPLEYPDPAVRTPEPSVLLLLAGALLALAARALLRTSVRSRAE